MKVAENKSGKVIYRDMTLEEIAEFEKIQQEQPAPEPDRLTALELAVAELGAVMMGGMTGG